ncbi:MAG: elongation factor G, partial [bacterium]|nr:elongation factor G [bacterium]
YTGEVINDLNGRRGRLDEMEMTGRSRKVHALVPLAEMFGYANDLRSRTQGRASHTMEVSHYEEVPPNIANGIMERTGSHYRFT